jgi:hypothetical protein
MDDLTFSGFGGLEALVRPSNTGNGTPLIPHHMNHFTNPVRLEDEAMRTVLVFFGNPKFHCDVSTNDTCHPFDMLEEPTNQNGKGSDEK